MKDVLLEKVLTSRSKIPPKVNKRSWLSLRKVTSVTRRKKLLLKDNVESGKIFVFEQYLT